MQEYSIRQLAERFQLPISTIRYYEAAGLLTKVGRTTAGQRVFTEGHFNRLRTICCFKHAGMSIRQLQAFFAYEAAEPANMDAILQLLQEQKASLDGQLRDLQADYAHVLRKLHYYEAVKESQRNGQPLPEWKDYKYREYNEAPVSG